MDTQTPRHQDVLGGFGISRAHISDPQKTEFSIFVVIFIFCMAVPCFSWICFLFLQTSQRFWPKKNWMAKDVKKTWSQNLLSRVGS